jgi:hypothetical protein
MQRKPTELLGGKTLQCSRSTTTRTWTGLELNPGSQEEMTVTNRLDHGKVRTLSIEGPEFESRP